MTIPVTPDASQQDPPISQTWALVPRSVLTDKRLSHLAVRLYGILDIRTMGRQETFKVKTMAADMGASVRSTETALALLVDLGYVTRQRTRGVSLTSVNNPARSAKKETRSAARCGQDPQPVADTSRSTYLGVKNNISTRGDIPASAADPALRPSAADDSRLSPYLQAARDGSGVQIDLNPKTRAHLNKISAAMTPEQLREKVAGWPRISWSGQPIYYAGGFYVDVVLRGIADNWQPPTGKPAAIKQETPTPPRYVPEPDAGGDVDAGIAAVRAALRNTQTQAMPV